MLKFLSLLFCLLFSANLLAYNPMLIQLQQEKAIVFSENQKLKTKNTELIKLRDELKKKKKNWGIATAVVVTTAITTTGFAIKNHFDEKKIKIRIDNKLNPPPPSITGITPISGTGYKGFKITGKTLKIGKTNSSWVGDLWINGPLFDSSGNIDGGYIKSGTQIKSWVVPATKGPNFKWENGIIGQKNDGTFFIYKYSSIPTLVFRH